MDLTLLSAVLHPYDQLIERDEPWEFDKLFVKISSELQLELEKKERVSFPPPPPPLSSPSSHTPPPTPLFSPSFSSLFLILIYRRMKRKKRRRTRTHNKIQERCDGVLRHHMSCHVTSCQIWLRLAAAVLQRDFGISGRAEIRTNF